MYRTVVLKRLDQGHLHPKLEVPKLTCLSRELNQGLHGRDEISRKEPLEQLNCYLDPLHGCPSACGRYTSTNTGSASSNVG
jgi:hypothetical protein